MKKTKTVLFMLLAVLAAFQRSRFMAYAGEPPSPKLTIGKVIFSDHRYLCQLQVEGEMQQGDLLTVCHKDADGEVKEERTFTEMPGSELAFEQAEPTDQATVSWIDEKGADRCEPKEIRFDVVYALGWRDLSAATKMMIETYADRVEVTGEDPAFASGRLIAKVEGDLPDISAYHPELIVMDEESHAFIQFSLDRDADECCAYLRSQENVLYADPDGQVKVE